MHHVILNTSLIILGYLFSRLMPLLLLKVLFILWLAMLLMPCAKAGEEFGEPLEAAIALRRSNAVEAPCP